MIIIKNRFSVNLSVHPFVKIPVYFQVLHSFLDSKLPEFAMFEKKSPDTRQALALAFAMHNNDLDAMVKKMEAMKVDEDFLQEYP